MVGDSSQFLSFAFLATSLVFVMKQAVENRGAAWLAASVQRGTVADEMPTLRIGCCEFFVREALVMTNVLLRRSSCVEALPTNRLTSLQLRPEE